MKDLHNFPTKHKEFDAMRKSFGDKPNKQNQNFLNLMNRFIYRYRMAKAFQTIVAPDVKKRTVDGYSCGMKLFMAYSAYDEIRAAEKILLKQDWNETHKYTDKELAMKIRKNEKMQELLTETTAVEEGGLKIMLKKFYANKNDEIMIFASSLRHSFVHGDFTTARSGLINKREIGVVDEVTEVILKIGDDIFSEMIT